VTPYLDKLASLTPDARRILCEHATEPPFSGAYQLVQSKGSYLCRRCGLALFRASSQFSSTCGWPSFDASLLSNVTEELDTDGHRIEIHCTRCRGHLGHVFTGEYFTEKNTRFCVNAKSLDFTLNHTVTDSEEAIVAGGCFWGVEHYLKQLPGVLYTEVGYTGGHTAFPTYNDVCRHDTGHYEATRILFDPTKITYRELLKHFFEIHDPTQVNGQGPDIGSPYQSAVFYYHEQQKQTLLELMEILKQQGYHPVTKLLPTNIFWSAELEHQDYYTKHNKMPYCHRPTPRFNVESQS
jgi:peptide methionine sulfoxide reductase msrA/msrB